MISQILKSRTDTDTCTTADYTTTKLWYTSSKWGAFTNSVWDKTVSAMEHDTQDSLSLIEHFCMNFDTASTLKSSTVTWI